ncbi:MAG: transporter substrate-binding domain-containing protein, partial [bacterium]
MDRTIKILITAICIFLFILGLYFVLDWFVPLNKVKLTAAEKEYLKMNSPIRVGVDEEFPPYVFADDEGNVKGLTIDYLELVEDKLGVKFEFRACEWEKCVRKLKNKEIDLLNNVTPTSDRSEFMNYTRNIFPHTASIYVPSGIVGITSLADLKGKRVGVRRATSLIKIMKRYSEIEIVPYSKSSDLVQALVNHQIEAVADYDYPFRHALFRTGIREVKRATESIFREEGTLAVHRDNPQLLSIMERGISLVRPEERAKIETAWLGHKIERPYYVYLYYEYFPWLLIVGGIIVLLAGWNLILQRRIQARTRDLQASRRRYKNLFTEAPVSLWVEDFSGVR